MKLIKLSPDDPDIFQTEPTASRCCFLSNHFEAFMQMYKSQGSTFWLRFLVSFKIHIEEKLGEETGIPIFVQHFQFIRVLNYIYISLHKRFIEGSNTAVKKLVHNLMSLTMNSSSYLNYNSEQWFMYMKNSKQLHTTFQNLFGVPESPEYIGFTNFVCMVYADFFTALCTVFEQWYNTNDLSEDEVKKIDSKIIYWLPPYDISDTNVKPLCFEKYLSNHWKEDLQRMLMTDNIHNVFSSHKTACCEHFETERNIFKVFHFPDKHMVDLLKTVEGGRKDNCMHTVTEVCMKDVCTLKPQAVFCTAHEKCFVRICHSEKCCEPFMCKGDSPCTLTCETKVKKQNKQNKPDKFWKTVSVEIFPVSSSKCDALTQAESYDKDIQTYLHLSKSAEYDLPLSMMKSAYHYQCLAELHNFDFNPRRTECLNRLRKKLSQKHSLISPQFNQSALRQPFYRENLFETAALKMEKIEREYCVSKGHLARECGSCFHRDVNSVAISSSNAYGRVILLSRISISVPSDLKHECCKADASNNNNKKPKSQKKSSAKKNKHSSKNDKSEENCDTSECSTTKTNISSEPASTSDNSASVPLQEEIVNSISEDEADEYSAVEIDDDIDEICKLIGIGEDDDVASNSDDIKYDETSLSNNTVKTSSNEDEVLDNFLKLIGVTEHATEEVFASCDSQTESSNKMRLRMCAYCKKKETRRKMFKKCSRCKEEGFPVHHYYCSEECLLEDWTESHEDEHLRFKKQLSQS